MNKHTKECLFFEELMDLLARYDVNIYHKFAKEDLEQMNKSFHTNISGNDLPFPMVTFEFKNKQFIPHVEREIDSHSYIEFVNEEDSNERYRFNAYSSDEERKENDLFLAAKEVDESFPAGEYGFNQRQNLALNHLIELVFYYTHFKE